MTTNIKNLSHPERVAWRGIFQAEMARYNHEQLMTPTRTRQKSARSSRRMRRANVGQLRWRLHSMGRLHSDQALLNACAKWREKYVLWIAAGTDDEVNRLGDEVNDLLDTVASTPAVTFEGLVAKALVILEDDVDDLLNDQCAGEKLVKSVIEELVALHGGQLKAA